MKESSLKESAVIDTNDQEAVDTFDDLRNIEVPPQDDWFYETTGPQGQPLVYLRFTMTGWDTRRVGPFESRGNALWALNKLLRGFASALIEEEIEDQIREEVVRFPLQRREHIIFQEEPYAFRPPYTEPPKGA